MEFSDINTDLINYKTTNTVMATPGIESLSSESLSYTTVIQGYLYAGVAAALERVQRSYLTRH